MRKVIIAAASGVALSALMVFAPATAYAIGIDCGGPCATLAEQIVQYAEQASQLVQETQTAEQELLNTIALPGTTFADISGIVGQIARLANQSQLLINQTGMMIGNLGTGGSYPVATITDLNNQLAAERLAVSNAMTTAGNAFNLLSGQLPTSAANFASLQTQALGAAGRQQTMQTLAGIAASQGQVQTNRQAAGIAYQQATLTALTAMIDRRAANDALNQQDLVNAEAADCAGIAATGGSFWGCSVGNAVPASAPIVTTVAMQ